MPKILIEQVENQIVSQLKVMFEIYCHNLSTLVMSPGREASRRIPVRRHHPQGLADGLQRAAQHHQSDADRRGPGGLLVGLLPADVPGEDGPGRAAGGVRRVHGRRVDRAERVSVHRQDGETVEGRDQPQEVEGVAEEAAAPSGSAQEVLGGTAQRQGRQRGGADGVKKNETKGEDSHLPRTRDEQKTTSFSLLRNC